MRGYAAGFIILVFLVLPFAGAADPAGAGPGEQGIAGREFNGTGADIGNSTLPSRYAVTPVPIDVRVEVSDTLLPGPKGEMAAGPRSIGFALDPGSLAILGIVVFAGIAGIWYLSRMKPEGSEENESENRK